MQHINDDIDELYRHAAEDYPLKIKGADWESVAKKLNDKDDDAALPLMLFPSAQGNSGKKYKYLLLLLLIPAGLLIAKYTGLTGGDGKGTTTAKTTTNTSVTPAQPAAGSPVTTEPAGNAATAEKATSKTGLTPAVPATASAVTPAPAHNTTSVQKTADNGKGNNSSVVASTPVSQAATGKTTTGELTNKQKQPVAQDVVKQVPGLAELHAVTQQLDMQQAIDKLHANNTAVTPQQPLQPAAEHITNAAEAPLTPAATTGVIKHSQPANDDDIVKAKADEKPVAAAATPATTELPDNATGPVAVKKPKRLYIGLYVAPDYTTVKYQPGNKVGFDFGGLVGYKITKSLSVEAGMSVDKKYYTSDGKYYNNTNSKMQRWLQNKGTLLNISGYSNLTSFPLTLKYDFKPGKEGNFFVAGGLISYIVHEENYRYQFDKDRIIYSADRSTKISTNNMLANISISAGYESALGNFCNFRIEPYYRVPVKGIGLGGLPITSMGLNIGLTKKIK